MSKCDWLQVTGWPVQNTHTHTHTHKHIYIISHIKIYGHTERLSNSRVPKLIVTDRMEGIRKRGEPRKSGLLRLKKIWRQRDKRWCALAREQKNWRRSVLKAKVHKILSAWEEKEEEENGDDNDKEEVTLVVECHITFLVDVSSLVSEISDTSVLVLTKQRFEMGREKTFHLKFHWIWRASVDALLSSHICTSCQTFLLPFELSCSNMSADLSFYKFDVILTVHRR